MQKPNPILANGVNPSQVIYGTNGESISVAELIQNPAKYYAVYSSFYQNAKQLQEYYGKNLKVANHGDSMGMQRINRAQHGELSQVVIELGARPTVKSKSGNSLFDRIKR